jgi:hypothetical protein
LLTGSRLIIFDELTVLLFDIIRCPGTDGKAEEREMSHPAVFSRAERLARSSWSTTRGNLLLVDLETSTKKISKPGDELELDLIDIQFLVVKCSLYLQFITRLMNAMKTNFLRWKIVLELVLVLDAASWIRASYRFDRPGYLFLSSAGEK